MSSIQQAKEEEKALLAAAAGGSTAVIAQLLLIGLTLLPLAIVVPANANIIATASLCVFVGCWRSVKLTAPSETMTKKDALKFPLIGSAVLVGLFALFKFLPKDIVNAVLTAYFVLLGTFAVTAAMLPIIEGALPRNWQGQAFSIKQLKIPVVMKEPEDIVATYPELIGGLLSLAFCCWYYAKKHWLANNVLGICFSVEGIEHLSVGSVQTGAILLSGLFFYDIFWVFCTPVMVTVAKSFDAPIKLLFPRAEDLTGGKAPFSMLGLGDIVVPGIFVALILRYDAKQNFRSKYFRSAFGGYVLGLGTTIAVMNIFEAAQPALLYIVPAVLGAVGLHAWSNGQFKRVFEYSEESKEQLEEAAAAGDKGIFHSILDMFGLAGEAEKSKAQ